MSIKRSFNTWRTARRTAFELQSLSTRELNDLGIKREEIDAIAQKAARAGLA